MDGRLYGPVAFCASKFETPHKSRACTAYKRAIEQLAAIEVACQIEVVAVMARTRETTIAGLPNLLTCTCQDQ